jgi:hypothetical protein
MMELIVMLVVLAASIFGLIILVHMAREDASGVEKLRLEHEAAREKAEALRESEIRSKEDEANNRARSGPDAAGDLFELHKDTWKSN